MARIRAASNVSLERLEGWQLLAAAPRASEAALPDVENLPGWRDAQVPGTVASAERAAGEFDFDDATDYDALDYYYRVTFESELPSPLESLWLRFGGLATLADVWLNGVHVLRSENMFLEHELNVTAHVQRRNVLLLKFSSLNEALSVKRPRPRFRTRMIEKQQLRWFRTTFLGRMPGWSPPVAPVGPWREVRLERRRELSVATFDLEARIEAGRPLLRAKLSLTPDSNPLASARLCVSSSETELLPVPGESQTFAAELEVAGAELWWPNGHGEQPRYPVKLLLSTNSGLHTLEADPVAFRSIAVAKDAAGLTLSINGVEVRCRGACWTPTDVVSLADEVSTVAAVLQAREAGMNMLRVGGTMIYESDAFYAACDEHGILVWQDYMFANCDYPADDSAFAANVALEARQFLSRTQARACLSVLCGGSEVYQQISMLGLPKEMWQPPLFAQDLRRISNESRGELPYLPSSPSGGALPFQADAGVTHYYGVGAYLRPLEDARRANVRFASECLAFANVPEPQSLEALLGDKAPFHDPRWKARVPRDNGPAWDFDDVRDHYVRLLFDVDPMLLRYQDPERALLLARVASGEIMQRTLLEWRRADSSCRGSLIWFLRDLWPGAGWGIVDAGGIPKAAYYHVKRALQPRVVFLSDEGVNGLVLHVINDHPQTLMGRVELTLWRTPTTRVASGRTDVSIEPYASFQLPCAQLFEHFIDLTHAYRFGPPAYDVAIASLMLQGQDCPISEGHHFVGPLGRQRFPDLGLSAEAVITEAGALELKLHSSSFSQSLALDVPGFVAEDSYFHLAPGQERTVTLRPLTPSVRPRGNVHAVNAWSPVRIRVVAAPAR
jgi:beta-mannosidase